jgi:streptogramin lyase
MEAGFGGQFFHGTAGKTAAIQIAARAGGAYAGRNKNNFITGEFAMGRIPLLAGLSLFALATLSLSASAQPDALAGKVTSDQEGAMEGVLVSAKKAGSNITITVVTDKSGHYAFPTSKIAPGQYELRIRAVGYELGNGKSVEVAGEDTVVHDIKLSRVEDMSEQLSNGEWLDSIPGTNQQKGALLNCVSCHTLDRPLRSTHTSDDFIANVLPRMQGYVNQSIPQHPQVRHGERRMEERGDARLKIYKAAADYLSTVNLSSGPRWNFPLVPMPRPGDRATHVIYTEYDLPRETIEPHDVIVDKQGIVWYSSFGEQNLGRLDPKTGKVTEFPVPEHKPGFPTGFLALRSDRDGNMWLGNMYQATLVKFDPKTEKFQYWSLPKEQNIDAAQVNMVSPQSSHVDGKVWAQNNGFAGVHRLDLATGKIETWEPFKDAKEPHNIYDVIPDSKNNAYFTDFRLRHIGRIDAKTGEVKIFEMPAGASAPRRATMDDQDRLWIAQYRADKIAMFDTKTEEFKEWIIPPRWSAPYDAVLDKNGEVWTGSMINDQVTRLDTKTGKMVQYLLPRETNIRRVFVDNTTTPVTFWVGSNHGASIVKLEPLD